MKSPRRVEFGPLAWVTSAWQWNYKERNFKGLRLGQLGAPRLGRCWLFAMVDRC